MLISLKIKNFRSISKELVIDMTKSYKSRNENLRSNSFLINKADLLKSLIIYGRNAAGKSNVLMAFRAINYLVKKSDGFKHGEILSPYEPYIFEESIRGNPVEFEIEFFGEDKIKYQYVIKFTKSEINYEALFFYPKNVISKLYERKLNTITYGEYYKGDKKGIEKNLLSNQLYLSKSASQNIPNLKEAYLFLTKYLVVSNFNTEDYDRALINSTCNLMEKNSIQKENMKNLLKEADVNILDFEISKLDEKSIKFPDNMPEELRKHIMNDFMYRVRTLHNNFNKGKKIGIKELPLEYESLGTKKLMALGGLIIKTLTNGGVLIIDELDKSLHPLLTKMLINLFHSKENNPNNSQLIFATHDSTLLDSSVFGREQICFIDKTYEGNTISYKLSDIQGVRKDIPFEKWYMSGRFSAIPIIGDIKLKFENNENKTTGKQKNPDSLRR